MKDKLKSKEFLKFVVNSCPSNLNFIKGLRFNKNSISVNCDKDVRNFVSDLVKNDLYSILINYLSVYIKENNINCFNTCGIVDKNFIQYKYKKLNVNWK